ncbi:MAG: VWA domain-containing protein [Deltaproteobacteria bacterium]|nr:VWA domain-containing protein [Deltaproteobacteria bacterium]
MSVSFVSFGHPIWLLAIVPAVLLAVVDAIRRWPGANGRLQRGIAITTRALVIAALAIAAAEPRISTTRHDSTTVFLIDRSASVSDGALAASWEQVRQLRASLGDEERVAVVHFDGGAEVAIAPGEPFAIPAAPRGADPDATDIGAAIRLGLGLIPPNGGGQLVLIGDGRATAGDLGAATAVAVQRGVPVSVVPSGSVVDDPAIASIKLDNDHVRSGATMKGHVDVDSGGVVGPAKVTVKVDGKPVASVDVQLDGKHTDVPFEYSLPKEVKPGVVSVDAALEVPSGTPNKDPGNDKTTTRAVVERPPQIVILDGDDGGGASLAAALRAEQMQVTIVPAQDGPPPDLANTDLLILANAPVRGVTTQGVIDDDFGEKLVKWVNDGGGLVVLGGPQALDANYAANRLADALPVEIEPMAPELESAATVIVILDQSGSMGMTVGNKTKLALAAEGAAGVIRLLRSFDKVAVSAVQSHTDWVIPLKKVGDDTAAMEAKVRSIPVGGDGIFIYTSLVDAQKVIAKASTPLRHIILFSDTRDAAEQVKGSDYGDYTGWPSGRPNSLQVARQLRESGTTLSVIGVGDGADGPFVKATYVDDDDDTDFLKQLALEGGGHYYRTTDAKQLRGLFVQDARRLLDTHAREEEVRLIASAKHSSIDGIDIDKAPPLHGYQEVKPRPAAQVVLTDKKKNPILTRWPYGLGEVAVFASDAGPRWGKDWLKWDKYSRFWTQLARGALRRHEGDTTAVEADVSGDSATVRVVRRTERANVGAPVARVVTGGMSRDLPLKIVEPGVYEAKIDVAPGNEPTVELLDDKNQVTVRKTILRPAGSELHHRGPDTQALTTLANTTGGTVSPSTIVPAGKDTSTSLPIAMWLILAAVLLLPLDASLRRLARG